MPGEVLNHQSRRLVINLLLYFSKENLCETCKRAVANPHEKVALALGISTTTVYAIEKRSLEGNFGTPNKKRKVRKPKTEDLHLSVKTEIREIIYKMYQAGQHITLQTLRDKVCEQEVVRPTITSLWRILKSLGFKYKMEDNRRALCEQPHVVNLRTEFLKKYLEIKTENNTRPLVFLDETWVFQKGGLKRCWQDDNIRSTKRGKSNEGKRFVILHAGSSDGFIKNAGLIFSATSKSADYHDNMNKELFTKWATTKLIPNLNQPSVIIMDNAAYHSEQIDKAPTSNSRKHELLAWLENKKFSISPTMKKADLYKLVQTHAKNLPKRYVIDELLESHGHKVLRLPPYHCQFNAVENIWSSCKHYYDSHIGKTSFKEEELLAVWNAAVENIKSDVWGNCVQHTEKLILKYCEREKHFIANRELHKPIVIAVNGSDSDDSDVLMDEESTQDST